MTYTSEIIYKRRNSPRHFIPETYFYSTHLNFLSLTMFGVFLKETATDYQILVNVKPYRTDLRILSKEKYSKASEIPVGVKVEFNESTIILAEYFDCTYCHMPEIPGNNCPSPAKNTVSATGKLIKSEFKQYDSGLGLKVGVQHGDITTYFVLFQGDVWFDVLKKMSVGDELKFKGVLHKNDDESRNNLVKLFYVRLL